MSRKYAASGEIDAERLYKQVWCATCRKVERHICCLSRTKAMQLVYACMTCGTESTPVRSTSK